MKHYIQVTYRGWLQTRVLHFDATACKHEVTPSGHLIVRSAGGISYSAAPGMWHEVAVINEQQANAARAQMQEAVA